MSESELEKTFLMQLRSKGLAVPQSQYQFTQLRKWRFDFAWPSIRLAVEIQGGTFANGRHVRGMGYEQDCEKSNAATLSGWRVLRFGTREISEGRALKLVEAFLKFAEKNQTTIEVAT